MSKFIDMTIIMHPIIGIYALYLDDTCIYVGQSTNIAWRISQHKSKAKRDKGFIFNRVWIAQCSKDQLDKEEFNAIRKLQPKYNQTNSGPRLAHNNLKGLSEIMGRLLQK